MALRLLPSDEPKPTLDQIANNPALVEGLGVETVRTLMSQMELVKGALRGRWFILSTKPAQTPVAAPRADRLLHVAEAAHRLGIAKATLYRNADEYPFTRRVRPRCLRFSELGIEAYQHERQGARQ